MKIIYKHKIDDGPYHYIPRDTYTDDVVLSGLKNRGIIRLQMSFPDNTPIPDITRKPKLHTEPKKIYTLMGTFFVDPRALQNNPDQFRPQHRDRQFRH